MIAAYEETEQNVHRRANGYFSAEDRDQLTQLTTDKRRALRGILSPSELEEYELRDSFTADQLRLKLSAFEPTENEFRAVFRLQRPYDMQFNPHSNYSNNDPAVADQMFQARINLEEQFKKTLRKDRYAEYQKSQDTAYSTLYEIAQRYEIPKDTLNKIYEIKQIAEEQVIQARQMQNQQQAQEILTATGQQTMAAVRAMLGEKAFQSYIQRGGGWLTRLGP
jgi:hypothetical protein